MSGYDSGEENVVMENSSAIKRTSDITEKQNRIKAEQKKINDEKKQCNTNILKRAIPIMEERKVDTIVLECEGQRVRITRKPPAAKPLNEDLIVGVMMHEHQWPRDEAERLAKRFLSKEERGFKAQKKDDYKIDWNC